MGLVPTLQFDYYRRQTISTMLCPLDHVPAIFREIYYNRSWRRNHSSSDTRAVFSSSPVFCPRLFHFLKLLKTFSQTSHFLKINRTLLSRSALLHIGNAIDNGLSNIAFGTLNRVTGGYRRERPAKPADEQRSQGAH